MDYTPLLDRAKGPRIYSPSSKAASHEANCSSSSSQEPAKNGDRREKHQDGDGRQKPKNGGGREKPRDSDGREKPQDGDGKEKPKNGDGREKPQDGDLNEPSRQSTAAVEEQQDAPGEGKATDAAAQGTSSDMREKPQTGQQDAGARCRFFPSARFPFSLKKTEAAAAARGSDGRPLQGDCATLIDRLEHLVRCAGQSSVISDPTTRLIGATRSLALIDGVDSKARREAQFEMLLASTSLTMVASREKIGEEIATTAKKLASDAVALLAKAGGIEERNGRSNGYLFCITISGALALLPYVPTQIPNAIQPYVVVGFGLVFYLASIGAILSFKATLGRDLKVADYLNTASFGVFSLLVIAFICSALASGNNILVFFCGVVLLAGHLYAWSRS